MVEGEKSKISKKQNGTGRRRDPPRKGRRKEGNLIVDLGKIKEGLAAEHAMGGPSTTLGRETISMGGKNAQDGKKKDHTEGMEPLQVA